MVFILETRNFMVIHLDNGHAPTYFKPKHTKFNHTESKTKFPLIDHNSVVFHTRISKLFMIVHLDKAHAPAYLKYLYSAGPLGNVTL